MIDLITEVATKRLVLGVTGGVAAYKAAELTRLLVKNGTEVQVVMTEAARHFVGPATFQALSGKPVLTDLWDGGSANGMAHIEITRSADAVLIAPASADFLAKLAHGAADDLLSAICLARSCPLLAAPAMNREMWDNPATQRNIFQLKRDGVTILGPASGAQACGETGMGRMVEPQTLIEDVDSFWYPKRLQGKRVLITAGPTFEAIDAVRGITNLSSGKMGYAVARAAIEAGAAVTLISGPTCLTPPAAAKTLSVTSAQQMLDAVNGGIADTDIFISVAAVADYYVLNPSEQKIKKDAHIFTLELAPNPDIVANVMNLPNPPFCVGFAAESENLYEFAEIKRKRKNLPLLAANLVQDAIGSEESELILFDDDGAHPLQRAPKIALARQLIEHVAKLYHKERGPT
ncbi:MAG TPA: bifunctional phosphopantothenoylcysteine decarboxylase/phosphopantothenate--cysteine ligase CoaBC [Sulfuricella sp.]|nr:bifunctional phosphopantothenoylcysteine decarboxylase/phosphopantothenate--cysteine ligase CoaBC [Sulfuricella sp.]